MMKSGEGKVVCVTGASGFIASWLVKLLLQQGYSVNATVRDPCDSKKTEHLLRLDGAKERLHLFKADLLEEDSFDSAIQGCAEILDPAVNGTLNVLRSCAKYSSVKRVIITSSIAAMFYTGKPVTQDTVADETWWSDTAVCKQLEVWYQLSKALSESAAWDFAKENGLDLVAINPGFVNGPFLQPNPTFSVDIVLSLVNGGNQTYPRFYYWSVDVRDVAEAHVKAFEIESASGRYCLVGSNADFPQVLRIIHQQYPMLHLPDKCEEIDGITKVPAFKASKKKCEEGLGMKFIPLEVSLRDTIECLKEKGFIHF
ncbi:Phenylacetaldehyde reductase [Linum grandiflorum]